MVDKDERKMVDKINKDIEEIMNDPNMRIVMEALAAYDRTYRGNVPMEKAKQLFEDDGMEI